MKIKQKRKIFGIGRFVKRNKPIKKVGIDSDNCLSWMENKKQNRNYKPKIALRGNLLYINYEVFGELMGLLKDEYSDEQERVKNIFSFLRRNKIGLIKKKEINLEEVDKIYFQLKEMRKNFKNKPGDSDLKIISIFYVAGMDAISTNNIKDFIESCDYLNISLEYPPIIEIGSTQDVMEMLRKLPRPQFKRRRR